MLNIKDLKVKVEGKKVLNGVNLEITENRIHALMGQNGSGKSTLSQTIMGNPIYKVASGQIVFEGKNLLNDKPEERAKKGIFLSFQYPSEVPGVGVSSYLRLIYNNSHNEKLSPVKFRALIEEKLKLLGIKEEMLHRSLNEGFSGGEKKKMEMLQMLIIEPKLAILDEVDSGLDVDALKTVAKAVNYLKDKNKMSVLVITHYARILKYLEPDFVHIMKEGQIVKSGDKNLAREIEEKGYQIQITKTNV
jgi:Fe-S cluster assembly ATP-binding protein